MRQHIHCLGPVEFHPLGLVIYGAILRQSWPRVDARFPTCIGMEEQASVAEITDGKWENTRSYSTCGSGIIGKRIV